ncbi:uncharacterized protein LOC110234649 [Exaiptasia diaphana]|uniref:Uncharacterized protein n=2 Tax=Exaiptasia diaphana TaxID=2652724 RepID=A0A913WXL7_EXADI|nr:uncharacterized protein LOC110234649 [Exaiptasia diaphana]
MIEFNRMTTFFFFIILVEIVDTTNYCPLNNYYIKDNPASPCLPCQDCPHGLGLVPPCGSELKKADVLQIDCKPCISGQSYSNKHSPESCKSCKICSRHEIVNSECTTEADTNCSFTCEKSYYFDKKTHNCQPCSRCCNDTKDLVESECIAHGMPETHRCSVHRALDCTPKTTPGKSRPPSPSPSTTATTTTTVTATATATTTSIATTSIVGGSLGAVAFILITVIAAYCIKKRFRRQPRNTPCQREMQTHFENRIVDSPSFVCSTCTFLHNELSLHLMLNTPQKDYREGEKCVISCQMQWNKANQNEISEENILVFTWYKDGAKLDGHDHLMELTLETLKVSDFGTYELTAECSKHLDGLTNSTKTKSESLFLDVLPGPGRRYKKLKDLPPQTVKEDIIAYHLSTKTPGIGNWKRVAELYGIPNEGIKRIDPRNKEDGDYGSAINTLEYIESSSPKETVYNFCKCLKKIKQNAIVEKLEDYLVCEDKGQSEC